MTGRETAPKRGGVIEDRFDFVLEDDGRLWLAINARETEVERPLMKFNTNDTLSLKRRPGDIVELTHIHPEALAILPKMTELEIVEVDPKEGIRRKYTVPIRR